MGRWTFLTNHGLALIQVARSPRSRIRDVADALGVTERTAQSIITDLVDAGYLRRVREGRRNRYVVREGHHLRHPITRDHQVGELLGPLATDNTESPDNADALVLACGDHRVHPWLERLLAQEGLEGRAELLLWPGGAPALAGPSRERLYEAMSQVIATRAPRRLLLVAHPGCDVPDVPVVAGSSPLHSYRAGVRWSRRIVRETRARLGIDAEAWLVDRGGATRVRTRPARRRHGAIQRAGLIVGRGPA